MLIGYLALTALPAALAARSSRGSIGMLLLHLGAIALLAALRPRRDERPALRWWINALAPLAAIPFLYAELPVLMSGLREGYLDAVVQPWELALFGEMPARTLAPRIHAWAGHAAGTAVSEILFASYLSYYLIIYVPPVALLVRGDWPTYFRTLTGMMAAFLFCYLCFVVFPVQGPRYIWPAPDSAMHGPIRALTLGLVEVGSSRGAEFPSSHVAVSVAQSLMALRWQRRLGVAASVCTGLLSIAVVFAGFHYAVDVLAGWVVGAVVGWTALRGSSSRNATAWRRVSGERRASPSRTSRGRSPIPRGR
jgi:membrane-associated phospholipid phosphatase